MHVRAATIDDAPSIAAVHVESWRWSYAGLLPQAELDALDVAASTQRWQSILAPPDGERMTMVVEDEAGVCGFASVGPSRDEAADAVGEVYAIYLAARAAGRGLGHALLVAAHEALVGRGHAEATLWVLGTNARARTFYEREGYVTDGGEKREGTRCGGEVQLRYRRALPAARATG